MGKGMMQSVDVVIIGGGMVGLALEAALKESDLRIAVFENHLPEEALNPLPDARFCLESLKRDCAA